MIYIKVDVLVNECCSLCVNRYVSIVIAKLQPMLSINSSISMTKIELTGFNDIFRDSSVYHVCWNSTILTHILFLTGHITGE